MAHHDRKPLPALPPSHTLSTLSIDARNHRARLINYFLSDAPVQSEPGIEGRREGWLFALEEALDELGYALAKGDWLGCVRRGNELKKALRRPLPAPEEGKKEKATKGKQEDKTSLEEKNDPKQQNKPLPEEPVSPLKLLQTLATRPALPPNEDRAAHLVLCVSPHGSPLPLPTEDSGFDLVPANIGCVFTPGNFILQSGDAEAILYGLNDLDSNLITTNLRLVGGTFTFKGISSPTQHLLLTKILRLSIYVHLSLILEQHLLADSHVEIKYPRPKLPTPSPSTPLRTPSDLRTPTTSLEKQGQNQSGPGPGSGRTRTSLLPSSVANFFMKRSFGPRSQTMQTPSSRRGSLDLTIARSQPPLSTSSPLADPAQSYSQSQSQSQSGSPHQLVESPPPRKSFDGLGLSGAVSTHLRLNRFSFMGHGSSSGGGGANERGAFLWNSKPITSPPTTPNDQNGLSNQPFTSSLRRIEASRGLMSTSMGVVVPVPKLLLDLANKEKETMHNLSSSPTSIISSPSLENRGGIVLPAPTTTSGGVQPQTQLQTQQRRRLKGDERVALTSLLGWEGKDNEGRGMCGIVGFVRHQEISVLVSTHVPGASGVGGKDKEKEAKEKEKDSSSNAIANAIDSKDPGSSQSQSQEGSSTFTNSTANTVTTTTTTTSAPTSTSTSTSPSSNLPTSGLSPCGKPRWVTYQYYVFSSLSSSSARDPDKDIRLGDWVREYTSRGKKPCDRPGCKFLVGEHEVRVIHDGVRVIFRVGEAKEEDKGEGEDKDEKKVENEEGKENMDGDGEKEKEKTIWMWESCAVCAKRSERVKMSHGTYLLSYAKFLELLIYSPTLCYLTPALCEHTTPRPSSVTSSSSSKPSFSSASGPSNALSTQTTPTPAPAPAPALPTTRFNIIRHFSVSHTEIKIALSSIEDIFELRVPRLQIVRGGSSGNNVHSTPPPSRGSAGVGGNVVRKDKADKVNEEVKVKEAAEGGEKQGGDGEGKGKGEREEGEEEKEKEKEGDRKKALRREIKKWWEGVADHIDRIEQVLNAEGPLTPSAHHKALPRLPSTDDAYELFDNSAPASGRNTPRPSTPTPTLPTPHPPPSTPVSPFKELKLKETTPNSSSSQTSTSYFSTATPSVVSTETQMSSWTASGSQTPTVPPKDVVKDKENDKSNDKDKTSDSTATTTTTSNPEELLSALRHNFHKIEQSLYVQLARTPDGSLNDVRRTFLGTARGAQKRLHAWKKKHLSKDQMRAVGELVVGDIPEWWGGGCHAVPGGNVIVREDDWGSVIAHTLSTVDYQLELASLSMMRPTPASQPPTPRVIPDQGPPSSFFSVATGYKLFSTSTSASSTSGTPSSYSDSQSQSPYSSSNLNSNSNKPSKDKKNAQPDPDQEDVVWNEPEPYSAVISRKEQHTRDPTSLLSIRDVLRHNRTIPEVTMNVSSGQGHNQGANAGSAGLGSATSNSQIVPGLEAGTQTVKAKANVGLSIEAVEAGLVGVGGGGGGGARGEGDKGMSESAERLLLQELGEGNGNAPATGRVTPVPRSRPPSVGSVSNTNTLTGSTLTSSGGSQTQAVGGVDYPGPATIKKKDFAAGSASEVDAASQASQSTIGKDKEKDSIKPSEKRGEQGDVTVPSTPTTTTTTTTSTTSSQLLPPPPVPPKDDEKPDQKDTEKALAPVPQAQAPSTTPPDPPPTSSGFASTLASGLNSAMRYVLNHDHHHLHHHHNARPSSSLSTSASPSRPMSPSMKHPMLAGDISSSTLDERPHIKYDWTIGKRLKFSCTVYYAKQFDTLRKRCGISNDTFVKSLSRSANWAAVGGKSKSNFWKTADERFIIKTLVNAWNVADLQVLNDLAPSYFRYMDSTASRATVLAKLVGFYTIEIRNLETGNVQSKADLLVMENLFYGQKISKTFDLKGIQGRKVKTHGDTTKTLFDGEWIEGQQRTLTLVRPHSKVVLREAIKNDAEFLSKSNIMDYSLLLGVDEGKKVIVCGLVDTIGSYTFAKTLEYKAKQGLQSGKEVTVMPPAEYQERFTSALEGYFVACPDKWSKPLDESKIISDPSHLPSVL